MICAKATKEERKLPLPRRKRSGKTHIAAVETLSGEASFEERQYCGAEGRLSYWLYTPAHLAPGAPAIIMLHGCTQTAGDFARGTGMNAIADQLGFIVAYPSQSVSANFARCWNWFKPSDQERGKGQPALIAALTRQIVEESAADKTRVYVAGLSAGGAAASVLGAVYPDIYAAIGIHSGLARGAAYDTMSAWLAMRNGASRSGEPDHVDQFVPVITFHGDKDRSVHVINSSQIAAIATNQIGAPVTTKTKRGTAARRRYTREITCGVNGPALIEQWTVHGAGHAWSGGSDTGTYTDASGPNASRAMAAFFLSHTLPDGGEV